MCDLGRTLAWVAASLVVERLCGPQMQSLPAWQAQLVVEAPPDERMREVIGPGFFPE